MRSIITNVLAGFALVGILAAALVAWYVFSGRYNIAAAEPHLPIVRAALDRAFHSSVREQSEGVIVPPLGPEQVAQGASIYARECARCHSLPGGERPSWTRGLRPAPPHLPKDGTHFEAGEIFWLVQNGARMTAMPSWKHMLSEDEIWAVAAFVDKMPDLTPDEYQAIIAETGADGGTAASGGKETQTEAAEAGERQPEAAGDRQEPAGESDQSEQAAQGEGQRAEDETAAVPTQQVTSSRSDHAQPSGQPAESTANLSAEDEAEADPAEQARGTADAEQEPAGREPPPGEAEPSGPAVTVGMTNSLEFTPPEVTISVGETVLWRNSSDVQHTVTADRDKVSNPENMHLPEGAEPFDSGTLQPGDEWSYTFGVPGRYQYVCLPHEAAGMIGEVIVKE